MLPSRLSHIHLPNVVCAAVTNTRAAARAVNGTYTGAVVLGPSNSSNIAQHADFIFTQCTGNKLNYAGRKKETPLFLSVEKLNEDDFINCLIHISGNPRIVLPQIQVGAHNPAHDIMLIERAFRRPYGIVVPPVYTHDNAVTTASQIIHAQSNLAYVTCGTLGAVHDPIRCSPKMVHVDLAADPRAVILANVHWFYSLFQSSRIHICSHIGSTHIDADLTRAHLQCGSSALQISSAPFQQITRASIDEPHHTCASDLHQTASITVCEPSLH